MNDCGCLVLSDQAIQLMVCVRQPNLHSWWYDQPAQADTQTCLQQLLGVLDSRSPRMSATQRILPVLPAKTTRGGEAIDAAFSVAGGESRPLTRCTVAMLELKECLGGDRV